MVLWYTLERTLIIARIGIDSWENILLEDVLIPAFLGGFGQNWLFCKKTYIWIG